MTSSQATDKVARMRFCSNVFAPNYRRKHTGERPYECEVCGKSFAQQSVLATHRVLHQPEKPHVCDVCGRSFRQRSQLRDDNQIFIHHFSTFSHISLHVRLNLPLVCKAAEGEFTQPRAHSFTPTGYSLEHEYRTEIQNIYINFGQEFTIFISCVSSNLSTE